MCVRWRLGGTETNSRFQHLEIVTSLEADQRLKVCTTKSKYNTWYKQLWQNVLVLSLYYSTQATAMLCNVNHKKTLRFLMMQKMLKFRRAVKPFFCSHKILWVLITCICKDTLIPNFQMSMCVISKLLHQHLN